MSWFKKDTTPMETKTGTDVVRECLRVRFNTGGPAVVGIFARELSIGVGTLEDFANIRAATLPAATLDAAAKLALGDNVSFDPERNLLKRAKQPSTRLPGPDFFPVAPRGKQHSCAP